jgi:hypothetical protein
VKQGSLRTPCASIQDSHPRHRSAKDRFAGADWLPGSTTLLHMIGDKIGALLAGFRIK